MCRVEHDKPTSSTSSTGVLIPASTSSSSNSNHGGDRNNDSADLTEANTTTNTEFTSISPQSSSFSKNADGHPLGTALSHRRAGTAAGADPSHDYYLEHQKQKATAAVCVTTKDMTVANQENRMDYSYRSSTNGCNSTSLASIKREEEIQEQEYDYSSTNHNENEPATSFDDLNQRIVLLGVDISRFQENVQFCICAGGVFVFTIAYGYLQELISVHLFSRQYTLFLSTCQFAGYAFWSFVLMKLDQNSQRIMSWISGNKDQEYSNDYCSWRGRCRNGFIEHGRYEVVETRQDISSTSAESLSKASTGSMTSWSSFGKVTENDRDMEEEKDAHDEEKELYSGTGRQSAMISKTSGPSWMLYITLSLVRAIDVGMTNGAMRFINYPMKTLVKSSRVAFTMMCGIVIGKKRYTRDEYVMVFMLVFGLCIFIHADMSTKDAVFHPIGLSMLAISLVCDGALANYSEQIMIKYNITQDEFQFSIYSISFLGMLLFAMLSDEFMVAFTYFFLRNGTISEIQSSLQLNDSGGIYFWNSGRKAIVMILFTLTGLCGSSCNGAITKKFGALSMSITSTSRKACTLFISFISFPSNKCTPEHLTGMTIFISALIMKSSYKHGRSR